MKNYLIYKITNNNNGKIYIGQTGNTVKERLRLHFYTALHPEKYPDTKFCRAIRKHGKDSFSWEIIDWCKSIDDSNEKERFWINKYDSMKNGYNSTTGGKNHKLSTETRQKISKALTGVKFSKERCKNISDSKKGKPPGNKGMKMSDRSKKAISEARKGSVTSDKTKKKISASLSTIRKGRDNPFFGKTHSKETKLKMSKSRRGFKRNEKVNPIQYCFIYELMDQGMKINEIAKIFNVSDGTIYNIRNKRVSQIELGWIKLKEL